MTQTTLSNLLVRLEAIRERTEEELRQILKAPDLFLAFRALQDDLEKCLAHLYNFEAAVDNRGQSHPILDVVDRIRRDARDCFRRITGKEYVPQLVRDQEHLDRKKENESG